MAATCRLTNYSGRPNQLVSPLDGILEQFGIQPPVQPVDPQKGAGAQKLGTTTVPAQEFTNGKVRIAYEPGCTVAGENDKKLFDSAVNAARAADAVLVFVGDDEEIDREGRDRTSLRLPGAQHELIQAVYAANPKTILVISSNCPVSVIWEQDNLPAIVGGMFLGEEQGHALADVICGAYNPGGKLDTTWYRHESDLPDFHSYNIRYGRTYMYFQGAPLYPFGHGLSYTTFEYKSIHLDHNELLPGRAIQVTVEVRNAGQVVGDEVVQFYVQVGGKVQRPNLQLAGFCRVPLRPGETQTVTFALPHDHIALRYWDESKEEFAYDRGDVNLLIGSSSANIRLRDHVALA
jgi:beta-glucosidase